jgi:hypothetical protein
MPINCIGERVSDASVDLHEIFEQVEIHNLTINEEPRNVEVLSIREDVEEEIYFEFKFKAASELSIDIEAGKRTDNTSVKHEMDLDFIGIIEYVDGNQNGQFDQTSDLAISIYPLSNQIYFNDMVQKVKTVNNENILNITKEQFDEELLNIFYRGYDEGYNNGLISGSEEGQIDLENNYTYNNNYFYHHSIKDLRMMVNSVIDVLNDDLHQLNFSYEELIKLMENGFYSGFSKGFKSGYDDSFLKLENKAVQKSETRSFWGYWNDYDINIWERPEIWLPRYKTITVTEMARINHASEIILKIEDVRGNFILSCVISNHFSEVENGYLSPSAVKFNMNIKNYPYENENTDLALMTNLKVKSKSTSNITIDKLTHSHDESLGFAQDEKEYRFNSDSFTGFMSWLEYVYCDGEKKDILVTEIPYFSSAVDFSNGGTDSSSITNRYYVILSYPRCKDLSHDPKLGFTRINGFELYSKNLPLSVNEQSIDVNNLAFILTTIAASSFIGISTFIRKKF